MFEIEPFISFLTKMGPWVAAAILATWLRMERNERIAIQTSFRQLAIRDTKAKLALARAFTSLRFTLLRQGVIRLEDLSGDHDESDEPEDEIAGDGDA